MRLTLRTLLAYLDDLLEPADAQDIGHRIEESEFATSIINRIHDCMRRLRLGVPPLNARGAGGDANTVAEYLDNTMAPDLVPEFERVCLESDVHLAEVAASHQILTLVLGEPAEIEPASRQRMYRLPYETPELPQPAAVAATLMDAPSAGGRRRHLEVPEYLREREGSGWFSVALMLIAASLLIAAGVYLFWPGEKQVAQAIQQENANEEKVRPEPRPIAAIPDAKGEEATPSPSEAASTPEPAVTEPVESEPAAEQEPAPADASAASSDVVVEPIPGTLPGDASEPLSMPAAPTTDNIAATRPTPTDVLPADSDDSMPAEPAADTPVVAGDTSTDEPTTTEAPSEASGATQLGRFVSEGQIMLRHVEPDDWARVPAREPVMAGDVLVTLPDFRGTLALTSGVTAQILGGSRVRLNAVDSQGTPELEIDFGRVVLMSAGQLNSQVRLKSGDQVATLSLSEASTVAGIQITPMLPLGADPLAQAYPPERMLFVSNGAVQWKLGDVAEPVAIAAPAIQTWSGDKPAQVKPEDLPLWLVREPALNDIERRATEGVMANIGAERSARLSLSELTTTRRSEVKSLAVRSLGYLDEFEPVVSAVGDFAHRSSWPAEVEILRMAIARDPETAAKVRDAFDAARPSKAKLLFRMLWGYTPDQLRAGGATELVQQLERADPDNVDLDTRVLASWNLEQITGERRYRPHDPPNLRAPQVRRWKLWAEEYERGAAR